MKRAVLWDVASCSRVDSDQCFRGLHCLSHQNVLLITLVTEVASCSEMVVSMCQATRCHNNPPAILTLVAMKPSNITKNVTIL
jgi:hypothetical protein